VRDTYIECDEPTRTDEQQAQPPRGSKDDPPPGGAGSYDRNVRSQPARAEPAPRSERHATVLRLERSTPSDQKILEAVVAGERWAGEALLARHGLMVERLIRRVMGHDPDLEDLVHDAFATILSSIHQVHDGCALKGWIASVAVHTAHHAIRKRRAARWIRFLWQPCPEPPQTLLPQDAIRRTYGVLEHLPADERVAFALRYLEEMELEEIAQACGVSVATIKRRLTRAQRRFVARAGRDPVLRTWLEEGDRWALG